MGDGLNEVGGKGRVNEANGGGGALAPLQGPASQPHPAPSVRPQQKEFDDCVKRAISQFRKEYIAQGGKALLGGGLLIGGVWILIRGVPGARPAGGVGFRAAREFVRSSSIHSLDDAFNALKAGGLLSLSPALLGALLIKEVVNEGEQSEIKLKRAIEECKKRFPEANHKVPLLL